MKPHQNISVCSELPRDSKERFRLIVDKMSEVALSIFFRILTHGYGFQNIAGYLHTSLYEAYFGNLHV